MASDPISWGDFHPEYIPIECFDINIKCPKCGEVLNRYVEVTVITEQRPKYIFDCPSCKWQGIK